MLMFKNVVGTNFHTCVPRLRLWAGVYNLLCYRTWRLLLPVGRADIFDSQMRSTHTQTTTQIGLELQFVALGVS